MNAFGKLGLRVRLDISEEQIREAFRKKAGEAHPDSGGDEGEFSELQKAREELLSPARRVRKWLEVRSGEVDPRGSIEAGMMDLFQKVAGVGSAAEAAVKAGESAQSALARGIAEVSKMSAREAVEALLSEVSDEIAGRVSRFPVIEDTGDDTLGATVMRDLVFLEKWRGTLRGLYGRLM